MKNKTSGFFEKQRKVLKRMMIFILTVVLLFVVGTIFINLYMILSTKNRIITAKEAAELENVDCVIVLGCSVKSDGQPSKMLKDRLDGAVDIYGEGYSSVFLMSGDHKTKYYNEVMTMKKYLIDRSIPSEKIFLDHAGYSTYDSFYRAKEIYGTKKVVIVTQRYHLYRAIYIARKMGIDAYGVAAEDITYSGQLKRDIREIGARDKDFFACILKPESEYVGEKHSLIGNGDLTNDITDHFDNEN